jgi:hypothetical protein
MKTIILEFLALLGLFIAGYVAFLMLYAFGYN